MADAETYYPYCVFKPSVMDECPITLESELTNKTHHPCKYIGILTIQSDDGASRVVDPVISYFLNNKLKPGKYRHYELEDW